MKKLLVIALILPALAWAAPAKVAPDETAPAETAPAGADVNYKKHLQARPAITHEMVEQLTVECANNFDIYQVLPLKVFNRGELRLIKRYLHDNMKDHNFPQESASDMGGARYQLDIAIGEILGEITYSNVVNCFL